MDAPALRRFDDVGQVLAALNAAIEAELRDAEDKIAQAWHWGEVGPVVRQAALDARQAITLFPTELPPEIFAKLCNSCLRGLSQRHAEADDDALSYYGPTMQAIARSLVEPEA